MTATQGTRRRGQRYSWRWSPRPLSASLRRQKRKKVLTVEQLHAMRDTVKDRETFGRFDWFSNVVLIDRAELIYRHKLLRDQKGKRGFW